MDHFYAFLFTLPGLENKRGRLPSYTVPPPSPTFPTSPTSDHTLVNPPQTSRTRSQSEVRTESVEHIRARRNSYAKERPSVHATPKKLDYQPRRRASMAVPRPPAFSRPQIETNENGGLSSPLTSSSISEMSSASSACSESTVASLPSEYKSPHTSPLTHFQLLGRPAASAMIIRRPRTSHTQPDIYEIFPKVEERLEMYLSSAKRYYDHIPFSRYYARYQRCYAVPVESAWARKHTGRVESPVKKQRSRKSSRVTEEEPFSFPEEYQVDLFGDEEVLNCFMAIAKAASREKGITGYRW
ncbi:hypothetical protein BDM02DRAFT_3116414 [Thelephora ganbajun]|uniref:Uncharacterized protein n=1 Tax=Thelephora ganbajun TaxID=370292 RepID=A0ACB6ZE24_THEGA|nr:hypothetical protein BDM02DRAFT_3116414 [Thelephora ganbajun]